MTLNEYLGKHKGCPVVLIQGLGFVGSVMSLVVANAPGANALDAAANPRYTVIGVDLDTPAGRKTVDSINSGVFPITASDPKIAAFYAATRKQGNFYATVDAEAFKYADVIIVDINLDVHKDSADDYSLKSYSVNLEPFKAAIKTIGQNCKQDALVLVETTVPPGTCKNIVEPAIKQCLIDRGLPTDKIKIGHSYERVMPGPGYVDSIQNFYRVYSGVDEKSADAVEAFLKTIIHTDKYPLTRLGSTNASEMAKVLENSYRAMNIAFVQDWSRMAEEAGVNIYEVVNAIRLRPTHANLMYPGIGVGGYCLTKDPLLASWARDNLINPGVCEQDGSKQGLRLSEEAVSENDCMPRYAFEFLQKHYTKPLQGVKVLLLGCSYRGDVGDTRFSPVEGFFKCLVKAGVNVKVHDPFVKSWPEAAALVHAASLTPFSDLQTALDTEPEIVVISTGHSLYKQDSTLQALLACKPHEGKPLLVYDTIGLLSEEQIKTLQTKHKVIVLGRGDL